MIRRRMERPLVLASPLLPSLPRLNHPHLPLLLRTGQKSPLKSGFPSGSRASNKARFGFSSSVLRLNFPLFWYFPIIVPFLSSFIFYFHFLHRSSSQNRIQDISQNPLAPTNCCTTCYRREGCLWRVCFHACAPFLFSFFKHQKS